MSISFLTDGRSESDIRRQAHAPLSHDQGRADLLERIDELAAADKRSRTNWLTLQIERIAQQQLTERAA
jgi:hypothetical protein